jgi:hypothetical protein
MHLHSQWSIATKSVICCFTDQKHDLACNLASVSKRVRKITNIQQILLSNIFYFLIFEFEGSKQYT